MDSKNNLKDSDLPPIALTIAGFDPSGGAGVLADVRTFSSFGLYPIAAVTSVTIQNTTGVFGAIHQSARTVRAQIEFLAEDFDIRCVKTGMLPTEEIIELVSELVEKGVIPSPVVDPVLRSSSGFPLVDAGSLDRIIRRLLPVSRLVTPNIPEAELMSGIGIRSEDDMVRAAEIIISKGANAILIKGGHLESSPDVSPDSESKDLLFADGSATWFSAPRVPGQSPHGTGCVLSSAIAAGLGLGHDLSDSVGHAKSFVSAAIQAALSIGQGNPPLNPSHRLLR